MTKYLYKNIENQDDNMSQKWWKPEIDDKKLKELKKRKNLPGIINTILYFSVLLISGYIAYLSWGYNLFYTSLFNLRCYIFFYKCTLA